MYIDVLVLSVSFSRIVVDVVAVIVLLLFFKASKQTNKQTNNSAFTTELRVPFLWKIWPKRV